MNDYSKYTYSAGISISKRGYDRLKKRNGWNKKTADRMVSKIYEDGDRYSDIKGYLRIWLKSNEDKSDSEYVLYGSQVYIFANCQLVATHEAPSRACIRANYFHANLEEAI